MSDTAKRRKPGFLPLEGASSGHVTRDALGNAVWEWEGKREESNGSFHHLGLSVEGLEPAPAEKPRKSGIKGGYDPYQTDKAGKQVHEKPKGPKKRDLRALSRHIEMQRRVREILEEDADDDQEP